jgi:hypothetical protein
MKKRQPNKNAAETNNKTPDESLPDRQEVHPVSHNKEIEKTKTKRH